MMSLLRREINRLYWKIASVGNELKSRPGDQRAALLPLYNHKNMQVRLKARALRSRLRRKQHALNFEAIAASGWIPQANVRRECRS